MQSYHDPGLVLTSSGIAILASYTALGLAGRAATAQTQLRAAWLGGGSIAMGVGIGRGGVPVSGLASRSAESAWQKLCTGRRRRHPGE